MAKNKPVETSVTEAAHARGKTAPVRRTPKLENYPVESPGRAENPGAHNPDGYASR